MISITLTTATTKQVENALVAMFETTDLNGDDKTITDKGTLTIGKEVLNVQAFVPRDCPSYIIIANANDSKALPSKKVRTAFENCAGTLNEYLDDAFDNFVNDHRKPEVKYWW